LPETLATNPLNAFLDVFSRPYFPGSVSPQKEDDDEVEDENDDEGYDLESCDASCCDSDCECDDCIRCANQSLNPYDRDDYSIQGSAK
jgi:hypothetical protein